MYKMTKIDEVVTKTVADLIAQGYMLDLKGGNVLCGTQGHIDLYKGDDHIRIRSMVCIYDDISESSNQTLWGATLVTVDIVKTKDGWGHREATESSTVIFSAFKYNDILMTEEEYLNAKAVHKARVKAHFATNCVCFLTDHARILPYVQSHRGFKRAKVSDIMYVISIKEECGKTAYYEIKMNNGKLLQVYNVGHY